MSSSTFRKKIVLLALVGTAFAFLLSEMLTIYLSRIEQKRSETQAMNIRSFKDCVNAGFPVLESMPRQCKTTDGRTYAEESRENITYKNASADVIVVDLPYPGAVTGKTFLVKGKARGFWYFEASFPIELQDEKGNRIAQSVAHADGDWMTTDFVSFTATMTAPSTYIGKATLILKKDNPSDMREKDASISFPITIEY
jgi:hypothetical protein